MLGNPVRRHKPGDGRFRAEKVHHMRPFFPDPVAYRRQGRVQVKFVFAPGDGVAPGAQPSTVLSRHPAAPKALGRRVERSLRPRHGYCTPVEPKPSPSRSV